MEESKKKATIVIMPEETRGSRGGNARKEKLSPERRREIAQDAARRRWGKKDELPIIDPQVTSAVNGIAEGIKRSLDAAIVLSEVADTPIQLPASPAPIKPIVKRKKPMVKEFGKAQSYAEKRLADALKERAEAMSKVAMLNAEIPSLVQVIRALGGTVNPQVANMAPQYPIQPGEVYQFNGHAGTAPMTPPMPDFNIPQVPLVPGAAVGGAMELDYVPKDEGPRLPTMAGDWR